MVLKQFSQMNYEITDTVDFMETILNDHNDRTISIYKLYNELNADIPRYITEIYDVDNYGWIKDELSKCWFIAPVENAVFWVDYDRIDKDTDYVLIVKNPIRII